MIPPVDRGPRECNIQLHPRNKEGEAAAHGRQSVGRQRRQTSPPFSPIRVVNWSSEFSEQGRQQKRADQACSPQTCSRNSKHSAAGSRAEPWPAAGSNKCPEN